jgi:hypothetical protein
VLTRLHHRPTLYIGILTVDHIRETVRAISNDGLNESTPKGLPAYTLVLSTPYFTAALLLLFPRPCGQEKLRNVDYFWEGLPP